MMQSEKQKTCFLLYAMHNIDYTLIFCSVRVYMYIVLSFRTIECICDDAFIFKYCTISFCCILHMFWGYRTCIRISGWIGNMVLAEMIDHSQVDFSYIQFYLSVYIVSYWFNQRSRSFRTMFTDYHIYVLISSSRRIRNAWMMLPLAYSGTYLVCNGKPLSFESCMYIIYIYIYIVNRWVTWYVSHTTT